MSLTIGTVTGRWHALDSLSLSVRETFLSLLCLPVYFGLSEIFLCAAAIDSSSFGLILCRWKYTDCLLFRVVSSSRDSCLGWRLLSSSSRRTGNSDISRVENSVSQLFLRVTHVIYFLVEQIGVLLIETCKEMCVLVCTMTKGVDYITYFLYMCNFIMP